MQRRTKAASNASLGIKDAKHANCKNPHGTQPWWADEKPWKTAEHGGLRGYKRASAKAERRAAKFEAEAEAAEAVDASALIVVCVRCIPVFYVRQPQLVTFVEVRA